MWWAPDLSAQVVTSVKALTRCISFCFRAVCVARFVFLEEQYIAVDERSAYSTTGTTLGGRSGAGGLQSYESFDPSGPFSAFGEFYFSMSIVKAVNLCHAEAMNCC